MSETEETVTKVQPGYLVVADHPKHGINVETLDSLKELAKWVIDSHDYFLSHETMGDISLTLESCGAANVEFGSPEGTVQLTLMHVKE